MAFTVAHPPSLARFVDRIWDWDMPPSSFRLERILPSAEPGLIFNLAESCTRLYDEDGRCRRFDAMTLEGPRTASTIIDTAEQVRVMGVSFRPGMASGFFRERMDVLADRTTNLADLVPDAEAARLHARLLDAPSAAARLQCLGAWLRSRRPDRDVRELGVLQHVLDQLRCTGRVDAIDAVARDTGLSRRRLARLVGEEVGLSPKRYLRLHRFRGIVDRAHGAARVDWVALALDAGYADQAHLCHEFRAFSGMTPTEYSARQGPWSDHIPLP